MIKMLKWKACNDCKEKETPRERSFIVSDFIAKSGCLHCENGEWNRKLPPIRFFYLIV